MTIRGPHFTVQLQWPRPLDPAWPNVTVRLTPAVITAPPPFVPIVERPPPLLSPPADFLFPNICLLRLAQSFVHPVGATLDETVPSPQAHPVDFQFANVAVIAAAQSFVKPVGKVLDEITPVVLPRQLDFQFPNLVVTTRPIVNQTFDHVTPSTRVVDFQFSNVALQAFAQSLVHPVGAALDETVPTPPPHQVDFQFPNLMTSTMAPVFEPVGAIWGPWPQPPVPPQDALPPNLAVRGVVVVSKPVVPTAFDRPQQFIRQLDFQFGRIPPAVSVTKPTVSPIFERPIATLLPVDAPIPNLLTTTLFVVGKKPIVPQLFGDRPAPTPQQLDFQFPNVALAPQFVDLTKLFRSPLIVQRAPTPPAVDFQFPNVALSPNLYPANALWDVDPLPPPRPIDWQPRNLVLAPPPVTTFVFRAPLIAQRVATKLPLDAPIPNLLTTTLSVVVAKPPFNFIFDRPAVLAQSRDAATVNLLTTTLSVVAKPIVPPLFGDRSAPQALPQDFVYNNLLLALQTPPGIPRRPNPYLFTDRPSPAAPSWDQAPPNNTILLPPPVTPVGLHQNPMFTTMGRLSQLGNLPS